MWHWISQAFSTYVLHPQHGNGYQWHSGIGSDFGEITIFGFAVTWWHHVNCVRPGCWRKGHRDPEHGHPVCRKHQDKLPEEIK